MTAQREEQGLIERTKKLLPGLLEMDCRARSKCITPGRIFSHTLE